MENCPSPVYTGPEGRTALHAVASYNWKGISEKLLKKHPTIITKVDDRGWSAIHYAALYGSNEVADELLKADKSIAYMVAEKDNNKTALHIATYAEGNTPLHVYAATPNFHGCDLVNHPQAEKNAVNKKNMTPLDVIMCSDVYSARKDALIEELKAKVAFAAGFTIPGEHGGNDGPKEGLAVLSRKAAFKAFIITDALAMVCSVSAVCLYFKGAILTNKLRLRGVYMAAEVLVSLAMEAMLQLSVFVLLRDEKFIWLKFVICRVF
ncbi:ankyrin repeat-containing At5g02620-like [Olea europaea subsp. europaea]|uniref:Ankyrin repeat-containing At5g02620-like n=1 Tax=Olea europaea subsp. europaea TaxID=158383 RepID=A0A8S0T6Y7_OLEEU|nr:ankyrin repeat-containing At5g02620-like [Olea europaea subsp. europaea]